MFVDAIWSNPATPWKGLGSQIEPQDTVPDILRKARLGSKIQRRSIAMRDENGQQLLTEPLKGFKAIVRAGTDKVYQVARNRYQPVQDVDIVSFFADYCAAGHATMETVGSLKEGAIVWALARLSGGSTANLGGGDELRGYLLLATSHDGSISTTGKPTQVRVVCYNTLMMALHDERSRRQFRMRHTRKWSPEVAAEAKQIMGMAVEQVQAINEVAAELSKVEVDAKGRLEFVNRLLGNGESLLDIIADEAAPKSGADILNAMMVGEENKAEELNRVGKAILEAMMTSPGSDLVTAHNTLWGAVNGVTYYVDHERGRTQDNRLNNSWFGAGDQLKAQAVQIAQDMAGKKLAVAA